MTFKSLCRAGLAIAFLGLTPGLAAADDTATTAAPSTNKREELRDKWSNKSPEEKAEARARFKERYEKMTPEQKAEVKERIRERRAAHQTQTAPSQGQPQ